MSQEITNWEQLQELFHLAVETPMGERERVLNERCADEGLVRQALGLVESSAALEGQGREAGLPGASDSMPLSGRVGPYTLLRVLGSGGIGTVYLAERVTGGATQRVALKMLGPHAAGDGFVERFHREQQILATLDHAHITRMLDAGITEAGQPWLVMEYVVGEHLDAYCDGRKLSIQERLEIFLEICAAVAYAHRNLVVHLDLKPSNILVTAEGAVKLLDFGTSKLMQPDGGFTATVMATPAYASPEQLRNEPVTTACDVFSLGAILYEMLSGRRPYMGTSLVFMLERALHEQAPEVISRAVTAGEAERRGISESRLRQALRGDLETIVAKCLQFKPERRYASVDLLTQDIERYVDGRPVLARPQTALYRMNRFVRRNWKLVSVVSAAVVLLAVALGYAEVKQRQAIELGHRAEQMQGFMQTLLRLANSGATGKQDPTIGDFLHLGAQVLPQYIRNPADLRAAQIGLARSLAENDNIPDAIKLYDAAGKSAKAGGDADLAADAEVHEGELEYLTGVQEKGDALTEDALRLSREKGVSARVRANAETLYALYRDNQGYVTDEHLRMIEDAVAIERRSKESREELGATVRLLADDYLQRGRTADAEATLKEVLQIYGNDPTMLCGRSQAEGDLGFMIGKGGDNAKAIELMQTGYQDSIRCSGEGSHQTGYLATYLADRMITAGRVSEALKLMQKTVPLERKVIGGSTDFSDSLRVLARGEYTAGDFVDAERDVKEAIAIRMSPSGKTAPEHWVFGVLYMLEAEVLVGEHRDREALPMAEVAERVIAGALKKSPGTKRLEEYEVEVNGVLKGLRQRLG